MICLFLEVLDGPLTGSKYQLREGLRMGRTTGEIKIDDPKMSSLHAQVELAPERGTLILVDRDSANGLRINNQKVKRVAMLPGVRFLAGKTTFRVIEEFRVDEALAPTPALPPKKSWLDLLVHEVPLLAVRNLEALMNVEAFRPALQLDFIEGIQAQTQVLLGYGPRRFGADVLDLESYEPMCPPLAFELLPQNGEVLFKTQYPKLVLLNGNPVMTCLLKEGDQIRIGQTLIQVSFGS